MKPIASALIALTAFGIIGAVVASDQSKHNQTHSEKSSPVLVELFTSEGCSSCPPADELLQKLKAEQSIKGAHIIALGQHVDYWNNLGWSDPYSSPDFSTRQHEYAAALNIDSVYTPQMVIDGRAEFVGSNAVKARFAIAEAAQMPKPARITLSGDTTQGKIQIAPIPTSSLTETADVYFAVAEDGVSTEVKDGENAGRHLPHVAVARQLTMVGTLTPGQPFSVSAPLHLSPAANKKNLSLIAFVQARQSKQILGVTETKL